MNVSRLLKTVTPVLSVLVIGLGLYCHKELIQRRNIKNLISQELDSRLIPHRINRVDRLSAIVDSGFRSFEVDVMFRPKGRLGYFEVGHDEADDAGVTLDRFLSLLRAYKVKKIWLDVKQAREGDIETILTELERLDSAYNIKDLIIFESSIENDSLRKISSRGFHTSYYLPTGKLTNLWKQDDRDTLEAEAIRLKEQLERQSVSAISFDLALYPFVKSYLEPKLSDTLVYHTWGSVKLWEWDALEKLQERDYFKDPRVKTILVGYWGSGCFSSLHL